MALSDCTIMSGISQKLNRGLQSKMRNLTMSLSDWNITSLDEENVSVKTAP